MEITDLTFGIKSAGDGRRCHPVDRIEIGNPGAERAFAQAIVQHLALCGGCVGGFFMPSARDGGVGERRLTNLATRCNA
jgi:hypothetical protein